jgi:hypothetical protein
MVIFLSFSVYRLAVGEKVQGTVTFGPTGDWPEPELQSAGSWEGVLSGGILVKQKPGDFPMKSPG